MKYKKQILTIAAMLVVGVSAQAAVIVFPGGPPGGPVIPGPDMQPANGNMQAKQAITVGAGAQVFGDILSGAAITTGDSTVIDGHLVSEAATTIGANSLVTDSIRSGATVTLGANVQVIGDIEYVAAITNGDGATSGVQTQTPALSLTGDEYFQVSDQRASLEAMAGGVIVENNTIITDTTFIAGVYAVPGYLTTAEGVKITLDAQNQDSTFIFNIDTYLALGAGTVIEVINGTPNTTVVWNITDGYASIGANADFVGTVFAKQYVTLGAGVSVRGSGDSCGGIFSELSYITLGADVSVGTADCMSGFMNVSDDVVDIPQGLGSRPMMFAPSFGPGPNAN
jgi:predicted acyltransferase (DUF342 family)